MLTYSLAVDGTERIVVPLGIFDTHVVRYRELGAIEFAGRRQERTLETTWWIAPELGMWVRRTGQQGEFVVIAEATDLILPADAD